MKAITLAAAAALGLVCAGSANAQTRTMRAGTLECDVSAGVALIIQTKRNLDCTYTPSRGRAQRYVGSLGGYGLDVGASGRSVMVWRVRSSHQTMRRGALAGDYGGAGAAAQAGVGAHANALTNRDNPDIRLEATRVSASMGVNLSLGVSSLTLRPAR